MLHIFQVFRVAAAVGLTTGVSAARAQPSRPPVSMSKRAMPVTSVAPVAASVEAVKFSGEATFSSRLSNDPDFGKPTLLILVDMNGVVGVGAASKTRYVLTSQEYIVRPHVTNHNLEFTFPMTTSEDAPIAMARTGVARVALNVDLATGAVTSLSASLAAQ